MNTRSSGKRKGAVLQEAPAAKTLSSPPATSACPKAVNRDADVESLSANDETAARGREHVDGYVSKKALPTPSTSKNRKLVSSSKKQNSSNLVFGEWDILPHGLGKEGDLLKDVPAGNEDTNEKQALPPKKRARMSKATEDSDDGDTMRGIDVKIEGENNSMNAQASTSRGERVDPVTIDLLRGLLPKGHQRRTELVETSESASEALKKEPRRNCKAQKKQSPKTTLDVSPDVLIKVDDLLDKAVDISKTTKNKYGLTPGISPYPQHLKPTPEDCEEVNHLLSELHGEVRSPEVIPPPSMDVTGCGEVPDLLDALLRTLLSASTTAANANLALKGLQNRFGIRESGVGKGSVNWEAVREGTLDEVINSIKSGGLARTKGANIKKILDAVHDQNCIRREALLKEKPTSKPADIRVIKHETQEHKDMEIMKAKEHLLSMDHVFNMTTDEAMDEMTRLPGIGVKTASCVILFCMKRPSFAVDTHVVRHCKWLGWVPANATRDKTFSHCEVRIPDHLKYSLHQLFLRHGKSCGRCRASTTAGTEEWNNTDCPIERLVIRTEARKQPGYKPGAKLGDGKMGRSKRDKQQDIKAGESNEGIVANNEEVHEREHEVDQASEGK